MPMGMMRVSARITVPPGRSISRKPGRKISAFSITTRQSAVPGSSTGLLTLPQPKVLMTGPPIWAMPWVSPLMMLRSS